jgi:hypothetical protein
MHQTTETFSWLGRVSALIETTDGFADSAALGLAMRHLESELTRQAGTTQIKLILFRALARAEMKSPVDARGAFVAAGNSFDALAAIGRILSAATEPMMIIDPYLNETVLIDFAQMLPEGIELRLLGGPRGNDGSLQPALARWKIQFGNRRPIEARVAPAGALHDRAIISDSAAWSLSQSVKDFAKRSPAMILKVDPELQAMKQAAYAAIWHASTPI